MKVYIDVLFLENILINYLILVIAGRFSGKRISSIRVLLGAIIGATFVVIMVLCPSMKAFYTIGSKLLLSFLIIAVAYKPDRLKDFLRDLGAFYITTLIFAGAGYAIINLTNKGGIVKNGVMWFYNSGQVKVEWTVIAMTAAVGVLLIRAFLDLFRKKVYQSSFTVLINIIVGNKEVSLPALVDTGNSLYEPVSKMPVIVVEMDALKDIIPKWMIDWNCFESNIGEENCEEIDSEWKKRFRIIPFNSIGQANGLLPGFKPDIIRVENDSGKKLIKEVVIGIYNKALSQDNRYKAIIGPS